MTEREYDKIHNEGGEGYNPIREARIRKEREAEAARPKTINEQMDAIKHQISVRDCSIARESGTYNQAEIDQLRADLKALENRADDDFATEWPIEVTKTRRAEWNVYVNSELKNASNVSIAVYEAEKNQGWTVAQLKKAVKYYNL